MELVLIMRRFMELCGASDIDRWSAVIRMIYDDETANLDSAFNLNDEDRKNPDNRLNIAFAWPCKDEKKKRYCRDLMLLVLYDHYAKSHKDTKAGDKYIELYTKLEKEEELYPDVAEVVQVSETADYSFWD